MSSRVIILYCAFLYAAIFLLLLLFLARLVGARLKANGNIVAYRHTRLLARILLALLAVCVLLFLDIAVIERNWIQVRRVRVIAEEFPPRLKEVRIVQISDLHIERGGFLERSLIKKVNALKPDIIVITGDFIYSSGGLVSCTQVLRQLRAKQGVYAILGNHDYYYIGEREIQRALESCGINVLRYDSVELDFAEKGSFWLIGISDIYDSAARHSGNDSFITAAFSQVPKDEPKVLLIHDPNFAEYPLIAAYKPQLILAGDTHGGQFGLRVLRKLSWRTSRSKYMAGLFKVNGMPLYVNRGITARHIRFLNAPEITLISLRRN